MVKVLSQPLIESECFSCKYMMIRIPLTDYVEFSMMVSCHVFELFFNQPMDRANGTISIKFCLSLYINLILSWNLSL